MLVDSRGWVQVYYEEEGDNQTLYWVLAHETEAS